MSNDNRNSVETIATESGDEMSNDNKNPIATITNESGVDVDIYDSSKPKKRNQRHSPTRS